MICKRLILVFERNCDQYYKIILNSLRFIKAEEGGTGGKMSTKTKLLRQLATRLTGVVYDRFASQIHHKCPLYFLFTFPKFHYQYKASAS